MNILNIILTAIMFSLIIYSIAGFYQDSKKDSAKKSAKK